MNNAQNEKKHLLVVDDSNSARAMVADLLRDEGFIVAEAESGEEALTLARKTAFSGVVMDQQMPVLSGSETAKRFKEDEALKYIPILMLTSQDDTEEMIRCLNEGADDFVSKNDDLEILVARIQVLLRMGGLYEQLKYANHGLEEKVAERTAELEQAQEELKSSTLNLIQNEKLSALGELSAGIAHELNQPLNGIKIITQCVQRDVAKGRLDEEDLSKDLSDTITQVNRMAELINHMRVFTRQTVGDTREPVELNQVVENSLKFTSQQLKTRNIEVVLKLDENLPYIQGNANQLEQVFLNLVTNARHAFENGEHKKKYFEILSLVNAQDNRVEVKVTDSAGGVPLEIQEKIFQPFFTTKEPGKGTGLGLSLSYKIIKEHGGTMILNSVVGEGSTFVLSFPILPSSESTSSGEE
ncbi:MAG: response regulator [Planctomycetes bacterium]|nr:response regulator [Planctomycetota bacterium]